MRGQHTLVGAVMLIAVTCLVGAAPEPSLKDVLARMERYVTAYEEDLSSLVAREHYVQKTQGLRSEPNRIRTLESDFLFLRLPGEDSPWMGVREVLIVDGRPVQGHAERLRELAAAAPGDARIRGLLMVRESARYNLGRVERTINVPVLVLGWMGPSLRDRFGFSRAGEDPIEGQATWRIEFRERRRPTIVRTPTGQDVTSTGWLWVEPETGRIWRTQTTNTTQRLKTTILVTFAYDEGFQMLLPARMSERNEYDGGRLESEAVYSDYRRFGVTTRIK